MAADDSGYNAGVAFLAIRPSLRGFQSELRRELRGMDLSADVRIRPDASRLRAEIEAAVRAATRGLGGDVRIGANADALRAAIADAEARLRDLQNSRTRPEIDADTQAARQAIAEVRAQLANLDRQEASPDVVVEAAAARTRLRELREELERLDNERADVEVEADVAEAEADLERLRRALNDLDGRRVRADVDRSGIDSAASSMLRLTTNAVGAASAIALIGSAVPAIAGLAVALASAAGAAGLIPAALGAGAAAFGTVKLGLTGISDALDAVGKADEASAATAAQAAAQRVAAAERVRSAQEAQAQAQRSADRTSIQSAQQVADARQALADAEMAAAERVASARQALDRAVIASAQRVDAARARVVEAEAQAARRVEQAERTLALAQRAAQSAQESLTRARKAATEQLEDLKLSLSGAALDEESAVLALERARERLANMPAGSSQLDMREAALGVRQAEQALAETRERYGDVKEEAEAAGKAGVEGSEQVRAAQERVSEVNRSVVEAERGLTDARTQGAKDIASAQAALAQAQVDGAQQVRDAQAALTRAQVDGAKDVQRAQQNLTRTQQQAAWAQEDAARQIAAAQRQLAQAMQDTSDKGSAAAQKLDAAMSKLSPNARALVNELRRLKPAWDDLRMDVQDRLLAGVSGRIGELAGKYLPKLRSMLGGIADGFNLAFKQTADFLGLQRTVDDLGVAFGRVKDAVSIFAGATKPLGQIFTDLFIVGSEFLPGLAQGFKDASDRAADFVRNARDTGELKQWIADGIHQIQTFFGILGDVGAIAFTVFDAANQSGIGFLDTVKEITGNVREFLNSAEGQDTLRIFFDNLRAVVDNLKPGLLAILTAIKDAIKEIAPKMPAVAENFSKIAEGVAPILKDIAVQVFDAFAAAFDLLADVPPEVLVGLAGVLTGMVLAKKALAFVRSFSGIFAAASNPIALGAILGLGAILASQAFKDAIKAQGAEIREKPAEQRSTAEHATLTGIDAAASPFGGIPSIWDNYWEQWETTKKRWGIESNDFGEIWSKFWGGLGGVAGGLWDTISASYQEKWGKLSAWWDTTSAEWGAGWDAFWQGIGDWVGTTWDNITRWPGEKWAVFTAWWTETSTTWGAGWNTFWQGVSDWIGVKWGEVTTWAQTKWAELSTWWAETSLAWQTGWNTFWQGIADWIGIKWQQIKDWVVLKWTETSTWLTAQIGGFETWWNDTWSRVGQWFFDRWEDIKRIGSDAWTWLKTNVWDPMVNWVTVDLPNAFQRGVDAIRAQWDRIRGIIGPPVEWIVNTVYNRGIVPVWNAIAPKVGLPALDTVSFSANFNESGSTAGQSGTNTANRLAAGGKVVGPGTETSDDIPAMLSRNEFVVRAKVAKKTMPFLSALNAGQAEALQAANAGNAVAPMMRHLAQGGLAGGQAVLNAMRGKPYIWGGSGPGGTDCSGLVAYVQRGMAGEANPYRRIGTTKTMPWGGWVAGLSSALTAGVNGRGSGASHMSGTLAGTNFEARQTGTPIMVGGGARGAASFPYQYSLSSAGGQYVGGGGDGGFVVPAWVTEGIAKANALLNMMSGAAQFAGTEWGAAIGGLASKILTGAKDTMLAKLNPLNVVSGLFGGGGAGGSARDQIIAAESGGSYTARNPTSSASGRYQMIDSTWRAYRGSSTAARAYLASPAEQDAAADQYVNARYGGWDGALAFRKTHGWYDEGGVASGRGIMLKQILEPERVLSPRQNVAFEQLVAHATSGYRGVSQRPIQGAEAWAGRGGSGQTALVGEYHSHLHGNATEARAVEELDHQLRKIRRRA